MQEDFPLKKRFGNYKWAPIPKDVEPQILVRIPQKALVIYMLLTMAQDTPTGNVSRSNLNDWLREQLHCSEKIIRSALTNLQHLGFIERIRKSKKSTTYHMNEAPSTAVRFIEPRLLKERSNDGRRLRLKDSRGRFQEL